MAVRSYAQPIVQPNVIAEDVRTWANLVTLIRCVVGLGLLAMAALEQSMAWNLAGLAVYWSLDVADGYLARRLHQETRFGAQFDILADRFLIAFFYLNYQAMHPGVSVVVALYLFEFMVIDHYLSSQFLRWELLSPNYFYTIDKRIWQLNWSPPGKFVNSGLITILLLGTGSVWAVLPVLVALYGVKLYSAVRMHRLPPLEA